MRYNGRMRSLAMVLLVALLGCQAASPEADARRTFDASPLPVASVLPSAAPTAGAHVTVRDRRIAVEVADTPESRRQGLSGRPSLAEGTGLVLKWERPEVVAIWMPDMNFPIDVVFVRDGQVLAVYADRQPCPPEGPCPTFGPRVAVDWVLEVPAGSAKAWGLVAGDAIALSR